MSSKDFTFSNYREILSLCKSVAPVLTFKEVKERYSENFIVIRHDIEYSISRAKKMADIEHDEGIRSTYLTRLINPFYSPFTSKNIDILRSIKSQGHTVGLHFEPSGPWSKYGDEAAMSIDEEILADEIILSSKLLSMRLGFEIDTFSFHNPSSLVLSKNLVVDGMINCYGSDFFTFTENSKEINQDEKNITYLSDSCNIWKYSHPFDILSSLKNPRVQLLTHAFSWHKKSLDLREAIRKSLDEIDYELKENMYLDFGLLDKARF